MKVGFKKFQITEADLILVPVFQEGTVEVSDNLSEIYTGLKDKEKFKGESGEIFTTILCSEGLTQDVLFVGLGKEKDIDAEKVRIAFAKALKRCRELKTNKVYINLVNYEKLCFGSSLKATVEGLCFADYKFNKYKSTKTEIEDINICFGNISEDRIQEAEEHVKEANILVEATLLARDLVNEPANVLYPETLGRAARSYGDEYGFEVQVYEKEDIEKLKMDAFMAVGKGSDNEPRLIVMRYFGDADNRDEILGLVGKGLTYDAGGYSLKPSDGMVTMKCDMGGAAAVIGAMTAIAKRKLKINAIAVVAACENLISGHAYKPGDIIGSMAGKTIEVLNTDAEGRLTLADAVYYITEKEKATKVIDVATLTGAALVALGTTTTAVVTNNEGFYREIEEASKKTGEKMWLLPAFEDYKKNLKSDIADLKNTGGRHAGTITAGLFIGEFVQDKPWLHLDIAGTAWSDSERDYYSKGGTGVGVRTLYYLAKKYSK